MSKEKTDTKAVAPVSWQLRVRRGFFKMSMREKVLLLAFALALLGVWASWLLDRQAETRSQLSSARVGLNDQQMFLDSEASIQANYDQIISRIDLGSLPSKDDVSSQIDALVRQAGFASFDLGQARTEEGTGFYFHTSQLAIQKASYGQIRQFTDTLKTQLPFVSLERVVIQSQTNNDLLDVRYILKSIERKP